MKNILIFILIPVILSFGQNGDFESWTNGLPDYWTIIGQGLTVKEENVIIRSGNTSAAVIVNTTNQNITQFQKIFNVVQGNSYNFSVYVYHTEGNVKARLYLNSSEVFSDNTIINEWQELKGTINANESGAYQVGLLFFDQEGFDGSEIVYVDDFTVNSGILPVELTTFTGSVINQNVELNWETATEVNNYGFGIERASTNSSSEKSWKKIGFAEGYGNSNSPKYYSYSDTKLNASGKYQYRLKQIDLDGTFEYSDIVVISFEPPKDFELTQNYPNPFNPITTIKYTIPLSSIILTGKENPANFSSMVSEMSGTINDLENLQATSVQLVVYDILGREVKTLVSKNQNPGNYEIKFNAAELPSGMYFYRLTAGSFIEVKKMLLTK